jgi:hypothetical protein
MCYHGGGRIPAAHAGPLALIGNEATMKTLTVTALTLALLTASAHAQQDNKGPLTRRSDAEKQTDAEIDKAYRAATQRGQAPAAPRTDPWQTVRPATPEKPKR